MARRVQLPFLHPPNPLPLSSMPLPPPLFSERFMAKENPLLVTDRPHQLFADAPPTLPVGIQAPPPPPAAPQSLPAAPLMATMGLAAPMGMNPIMQLPQAGISFCHGCCAQQSCTTTGVCSEESMYTCTCICSSYGKSFSLHLSPHPPTPPPPCAKIPRLLPRQDHLILHLLRAIPCLYSSNSKSFFLTPVSNPNAHFHIRPIAVHLSTNTCCTSSWARPGSVFPSTFAFRDAVMISLTLQFVLAVSHLSPCNTFHACVLIDVVNYIVSALA